MKSKAVSALLLTLLLTSMLTLALNIQPVKSEPTPTISVYPPIITTEIDQTFTINITLTGITEEESLYAWGCKITFNPKIINAVNATEGPFLKNTGYETDWFKKIDNTTGTVYVCAMFHPPFPENGATGSGTLAMVTFKVVGTGETGLDFKPDFTELFTLKGEVDRWEFPIDHIAEGGLVSTSFARGLTIHVSPSQAPIGSKINISGEEFPSKQDVSITFEDLYLCSVTTGENGEFNATLFVPVVDSGNYTIKAMLTYPYQVAIANASFTVTLGVDNLLLQYTYLNSSYNELESSYSSLNTTYCNLFDMHSQLQSDFNDLESEHDTLTSDLGTARNLSYVFVMTTIVFVATTVYLATRKPKVKPEQKTT